MDYGIKVSEEGYDVKTAGDKNLSLKSGLTLLKVAYQGNLSIDNAGFDNTVTHDLGYIPQYFCFVSNGTNVYLAKGYFGDVLVPVGLAKIDTSKLYVYKTGTGFNAFYYIFYEPVETGTAPSRTPTNDYGIIISKDGVDVKKANVLEQTFNSELNSLKIITDGTETSTASGARDITVAHGLNFKPGFLVFYEVDNNGKWFFDATREDVSGKGVSIDCYSNSSNLIISIYSTANAVVKVHYYILADPGENV